MSGPKAGRMAAALLFVALLSAPPPAAGADSWDSLQSPELFGQVRAKGGSIGAGGRSLRERAARMAAQAREAGGGKPAPAFVLPGLRGETLVLAPGEETGALERLNPSRAQGESRRYKVLTGKVVLLEFWAPWCGACLDALPEAQRLYERFGYRGLEVVGIAIQSDERKVLDAVAPADASGRRAWKYGYDFALDDGYASAPYGVPAVPAYVLIDRAGRVVLARQGFDRDQLYRAISELLK